VDNCAPVLIPTLNRYAHFERCVESLSACTHADKTDLYVAFDYPLTESHWDGYNKINEYLPTIKRFKSVNIIRREKNFGGRGNIADARKAIFEKYDRMILSEDDNEFSPNFLDYINKGLDKFEDDEDVLAVCGYQFPVSESSIASNNNYYQCRSLSAWGFGTWKSKWKVFHFSPVILEESLKNWRNVLNMYRRNPSSLLTVLNFIKNKKNLYGDMAIGFYMSHNPKCHCVFPVISKVRNNGHDGSGEHCGILPDNNYFESQEIDSETEFEFSDFNSEFDKYMNKKVSHYFNISIKGKAKTIFNYINYLIKKCFNNS